ncbi:MAG TPA: RIP metalloprotease RseP [Candidatus Paceibacterota bacterium]
MSILIFLIVLAVLIFVHELGHFIVAKKSGIKVEEFGIGFPPRLWSKRKGETLYSINAIPFGGFVKIFGENPDQESIHGSDSSRALFNKPRVIQAAVLFAGVFFNVLLAWFLISLGYIIGLPASTENFKGPGEITNPKVVITFVMENSPASQAGIKVGDVIRGASHQNLALREIKPQSVSNFIDAYGSDGVNFTISRGKEIFSTPLKSENIAGSGRQLIGISMDEIGTLKLPAYLALREGLKTTAKLVKETAVGIVKFIGNAIVGKGDLSQVTGPVGIVGLVGDVSKLGFVYLVSFTAVISVNLAIINLLPFPALDGGRLLFLGIEALIRRPISYKITNRLNQIGFALLILLMIVVTFRDITKLFGS